MRQKLSAHQYRMFLTSSRSLLDWDIPLEVFLANDKGSALAVLKGMRPASSRRVLPAPYWGLRDYGVPGQIGLEKTPEEYVAWLVEVFRDVRLQVLVADGALVGSEKPAFQQKRPRDVPEAEAYWHP